MTSGDGLPLWPQKTLDSLLVFLTSGSRGWGRYYADEGSLFLRIQNVGRNKILLDDVAFVNAPETAETNRTRVQPGDVLLSITADLGRTAVVPPSVGRAYVNQHLAILRVANIYPGYLSAFLSSPAGQEQISGRNRHGVKAGLNFDDIRSLRILTPPLEEQRRIAEVLDRAEALRAKRRAALALLDTLTQSLFMTTFGDPQLNTNKITTTNLASVCRRITDGTHQPPTWASTGNPFLFVSNIVSGEIDFATTKFISDETHEALTQRCPIEIGDILYSTVGSYGVPAVVRTSRKFAFQRHIAHLKPEPQLINSDFLRAMLASEPLRRQADRVARGVAQKTVNLVDIRHFTIFQPPLLLQQDFARRIAAVEKLKSAHRASLVELDALFASLQHRAFRGEL